MVVGGGHQRTWLPVALELDPGNQRLFTLFSVLGMYILSTSPVLGVASRIQPSESDILLRYHLDYTHE